MKLKFCVDVLVQQGQFHRKTTKKMAPKTKIVKLKLSSETLKDFPVENTLATPKSRRKSSTSKHTLETPTPVKKEQTEQSLDVSGTPSRATTPSKNDDTQKKKGGRGAGFGNKGGKRSLLSSPAPESSPAPADSPMTNDGKSNLGKAVTNGEDGEAHGNGDADETEGATAGSVRRWVKKPIDITSFTGYNIEFKSWCGGEGKNKNKIKTEGGEEAVEDGGAKSTIVKKENDSSVNKSSGLKIQIKLNNKNLDTDGSNVNSRDQSPALPDDASSIVSTPDGSTIS